MSENSNYRLSILHGTHKAYANAYFNANDFGFGSFVVIGDNPSLYTVNKVGREKIGGEFELYLSQVTSTRYLQEVKLTARDGEFNYVSAGDWITFTDGEKTETRSIEDISRLKDSIIFTLRAPFKNEKNVFIEKWKGTWTTEKNYVEIAESFVGRNLHDVEYLSMGEKSKFLGIPYLNLHSSKYRAAYAAIINKLDQVCEQVLNSVGKTAAEQPAVEKTTPVVEQVIKVELTKQDTNKPVLLQSPYTYRVKRLVFKTDKNNSFVFLSSGGSMIDKMLVATPQAYTHEYKDFILEKGADLTVVADHIHFDLLSCEVWIEKV